MDIRSDQVKTLIYACLCGNGVKDIIKEIGVEITKKLTIQLIKKIPGSVLTKINQQVVYRLLATH